MLKEVIEVPKKLLLLEVLKPRFSTLAAAVKAAADMKLEADNRAKAAKMAADAKSKAAKAKAKTLRKKAREAELKEAGRKARGGPGKPGAAHVARRARACGIGERGLFGWKPSFACASRCGGAAVEEQFFFSLQNA